MRSEALVAGSSQSTRAARAFDNDVGAGESKVGATHNFIYSALAHDIDTTSAIGMFFQCLVLTLELTQS